MDEAFLELMEQKDFAYITVTEICRKAGVNRSTFYLHYETVEDLLAECVEDLNRGFNQCFKVSTEEFRRTIETASLQELFLITPDYLIPYLTYVSEHRTVFRVVLAKPGAMGADKVYMSLFCQILNPILARYRVPEEDRDYMLSFYVNGMMGIVRRWLQMDCKTPVDRVAGIMMTVVRR